MKAANPKLQIPVKILEEQVDSKSYTVLQFVKTIEASEKGYFMGNEETIGKKHAIFMQEVNDLLIAFYKRENVTSVVDFGCGRCGYAMNIKKAGIDAAGYDGNPYT